MIVHERAVGRLQVLDDEDRATVAAVEPSMAARELAVLLEVADSRLGASDDELAVERDLPRPTIATNDAQPVRAHGVMSTAGLEAATSRVSTEVCASLRSATVGWPQAGRCALTG